MISRVGKQEANIDALFGGGQSEQTPIDLTSPESAALRNSLSALILGGLGVTAPQTGEIRIPGEPNPRTTVTPTSPTLTGIPAPSSEQLGVVPMSAQEETLLGRLGGGSPTDVARRRQLNQTLKGRFLPGDAEGNPFLRQMIRAAQRPTLQGLTEQLERSLPGRFTQAGQFTQPGGSSAFDRAAAIATRGATQEMGDIATRLSFGAFEGERNRQFAAQEGERQRQLQAAQLSQQDVQSTVQALQAAALPRLIQQQGLDRGLEDFNRRMNTLLQILHLAAGTTQTTPVSMGQQSQTGGIIPALSGAAQAFIPQGFATPFGLGPS